ncbi:undecaprenyl/decaprenyl-phosphate alpha-N-acetylglucosaminyl 1-phosphate transferase [Candidatus Berkelbacteria bacterium]|nr:undecaprenyl/decaprenyl-phosphate alpha-N-acetylglucosaminyl 1-phosphate transferase [Candidatus Berkelbacteria bacterium]
MTLWFPFLIALLVSAALVPAVRWLALAWNVVASPGGRHIHTKPTPKLGGLAVAGSFFVIVIGYLLVAPVQLQFVSQTILGIDQNLFGVLLGGFILVITGVIDDKYDLSPWLKLAFQILATLCVVGFGVRIWWIANPFGGLNIVIGNWTYLLVPLWLLLMINVMNWFDGLDGLSSGLSFIASIAIVFLSLTPPVNQPATALLAAIVAGAALGFLPANWHPARIFLGDSGSMFLGFMVGVFAIISGAKFATAALVLGIPIFDAVWVIARRLLTGRSPMRPDRKHLHHRFLDAGFSAQTSVLILCGLAALFGLIALVSGTEGKVTAIGWLLGIMVILGLLLLIASKRRQA